MCDIDIEEELSKALQLVFSRPSFSAQKASDPMLEKASVGESSRAELWKGAEILQIYARVKHLMLKVVYCSFDHHKSCVLHEYATV